MIVGNLIATFDLDAKGFTSGMKKVEGATNSAANKAKNAESTFKSFSNAVSLAGAAAAGATIIKFTKMSAEIEAMDRRLRAATGSAKNAARAWSFLRKESERLGISLEDGADRFGALAAAVKGTALEGEQAEKIFSALAETAAVLGMNSQRVQLTFLAIEQMASKGVISMEELRRQFGENVPGAIGTMARALGVTTMELNKLVSSGKLLAEDVLPLLANQLSMENAKAVSELGDSVHVSLGKMATAWFELKKVMADGTVGKSLQLFVDLTRVAISNTTFLASALQKTVNALSSFSWTLGGGEAKSLYDTFHDNMQIGIKSVKDLEKVQEQAFLSEETIQAKRVEIMEKAGKATKEYSDDFGGALREIDGALNVFSTYIADVTMGVDTSFSEMLKSMTSKILEFTTNLLVVKPIMMWLESWIGGISSAGAGGGGGGVFGAIASFIMPAFKKFADGGIINEPVLGVGTRSHSGYLLGEAGPEAVSPLGKSGGGGGGAANNINININALDSKSVTELLRDNPQAVTTPLVEAITNGDRGLASSIRLAVN